VTDAPITRDDLARIGAAALEWATDLRTLASRRNYCSGYDDLAEWADEAAHELRKLAGGIREIT
jgi:hypothetical protein